MTGCTRIGAALLFAAGCLAATAQGAEPTAAEMDTARAWVGAALPEGGGPAGFYSFGYGDKTAAELLPGWTLERTRREEAGRVVHTVTRTDPATGLSVACEMIEHTDFPAVEWVFNFTNTGAADTPIIKDILPLDCAFPLTRDKGARVHHANGSECRLDDFAPHATSLGPNEHDPQGTWRGEGNPLTIESKGGRSSCGALPFFNIETDNRGIIAAVGWTGDWRAFFFRTEGELRAGAGMKRTHFLLHPGEEARTPRMLLLFWEGDRMRGHNLLRRFILGKHTPAVNGAPARGPVCNATWGGNYAAKHAEHAKWWRDNNLPLDYLWVDAGWFGEDEAKPGATVFNSQWGRFVGDWAPNSGYFPQGLKPVADAAADAGMGLLLWLESERVFKGTKWTREHPGHMLGPVGDNYLLDLGNPDARKMLEEHLAALISENRIGCYRQDFNMDPRPFWDGADTPDRVGLAEIRHITGLYALWDNLRARFPGLLIDNCSSGGRRIDLESISRSMPLWRSDVQCWPGFGATAMQGQTQGLGLWVPLSTGCCDREDTYVFRSALGPGMVLIMYEFEQDTAKHFSVDWLRARMGELNAVRDLFLGDLYPLLSFSLSDDDWSAWQYDRPDTGRGMVLALRRPNSPFTTMKPRLRGLDPAAEYELKDQDGGKPVVRTGRELMESGLELLITDQPGSRLILYTKR